MYSFLGRINVKKYIFLMDAILNKTYHINLHLVDGPIVLKVEEEPVPMVLLLLRLQQSHGHLHSSTNH